jgi:hypothetical protein
MCKKRTPVYDLRFSVHDPATGLGACQHLPFPSHKLSEKRRNKSMKRSSGKYGAISLFHTISLIHFQVKHILIFLLVSISLQTCIHFKAKQKASRHREEDFAENDADNTLPTKARAARAPAQEEKKETSFLRESLGFHAEHHARSLYRRARDLSISQRASRCAPRLCRLEPSTAP